MSGDLQPVLAALKAHRDRVSAGHATLVQQEAQARRDAVHEAPVGDASDLLQAARYRLASQNKAEQIKAAQAPSAANLKAASRRVLKVQKLVEQREAAAQKRAAARARWGR